MAYTQLSTTNPVARKGYRCIWCGEPILKGEKHKHEAGVSDGDFQANRFHEDCHKAMRDYFTENPGEEYFEPYENFRGKPESKWSNVL